MKHRKANRRKRLSSPGQTGARSKSRKSAPKKTTAASASSPANWDTQALKAELLERLKLQQRLRLEASLPEFIRAAWKVLEPGNRYSHNWHIDLIAERLTALRQRQIRRLIINIPPRCMKSLLCSVMWPAWIWTTEPERRFLFASYSDSLSTKHSVDRRTLMSSAWYQSLWAHRFRFASDQNVKTEFQNTARGHMIATSVTGTATGKGGDFLVVDDPHNPKQALSELEREAAIRFFTQTLVTRLDDPKTGSICVIMQRLHELDLSGYLLAKGGWEHISLPMEYEGSAQDAGRVAVA